MAGSATDVAVRPATEADAGAMQYVEDAAHGLLRGQGVDLDVLVVPDNFEEPTDWDLALVAEVSRRIIGMARLTELDSHMIALDQLSVHPSVSRQGVGRALLLAAVDLCRDRGYSAITGTTFREVVFNAPFYAALGAVEDTDPHPVMAERRRVEAALGLDTLGPRVVMRVPL